MDHILRILGALTIFILYMYLKKNNIIEGHGGLGGGFGHGGIGYGGRGFGHGGIGYGGRGWGYGGRGRRGWDYGGGWGGNGWGYDSLYYQPINNLCYDSLGNLTYCLRPSYFY